MPKSFGSGLGFFLSWSDLKSDHVFPVQTLAAPCPTLTSALAWLEKQCSAPCVFSRVCSGILCVNSPALWAGGFWIRRVSSMELWSDSVMFSPANNKFSYFPFPKYESLLFRLWADPGIKRVGGHRGQVSGFWLCVLSLYARSCWTYVLPLAILAQAVQLETEIANLRTLFKILFSGFYVLFGC